MARQCSDCVFVNYDGNTYTCHYNSPPVEITKGQADWPIVNDTDWCGQGYDGANWFGPPPRKLRYG